MTSKLVEKSPGRPTKLTPLDNVLWLDYCAPSIKGFYRKKLWLLLPGGFHTVRVLSWLQKESQPMF